MALGELLVGILQAEVSMSNVRKLLSFLMDRIGSKPIELEVESGGRKLLVKASSREELEAAIKVAHDFIGESYSEGDITQNQLLTNFEEEAEYYFRLLSTAANFLQQAGARVEDRDKRSLYIISIPNHLKLQTPATVLIAGGFPTRNDIAELVQTSKEFKRDGFRRAGLLLYEEAPDLMVRMRIAEARLDSNFAIVPIPLAEIDNALQDRRICEAVLTSYVSRYIQRADFFDDRNAISDTISFFGRIDLLDRLREELLGYQGVGLFGLRKSGKTSILYQLSFLFRKNPVVRIDLQQYSGFHYGADLFNDILSQLSTYIKKNIPTYEQNYKNFVSGTPAKDLATEFTNKILAISGDLEKAEYQFPILCFFDEVERVLPAPSHPKEKAEEFNACFGVLRALCQNQRRLSILVADVHPDCNRINHWVQEDVATNPVFGFFKEIFLTPFSEQETVDMLTGIGKFMGFEFDDQTPKQIYQESGGHPFIARQLARFLSRSVLENGGHKFEWMALKDTLENSLFEFDELGNYFEKSVWEDFEKRNFQLAISILRVLAASKNFDRYWVKEICLKEKLKAYFDPIKLVNDYKEAIKRLTDVGIVERQREADGNEYRIRMLHLLRWVRMQMTEEELQKWSTI